MIQRERERDVNAVKGIRSNSFVRSLARTTRGAASMTWSMQKNTRLAGGGEGIPRLKAAPP